MEYFVVFGIQPIPVFLEFLASLDGRHGRDEPSYTVLGNGAKSDFWSQSTVHLKEKHLKAARTMVFPSLQKLAAS